MSLQRNTFRASLTIGNVKVWVPLEFVGMSGSDAPFVNSCEVTLDIDCLKSEDGLVSGTYPKVDNVSITLRLDPEGKWKTELKL